MRIKAFYRTSENAVKTQIWTAITVYVLVAIVKKRLNLEMSLYRNTAQNVVYDFIVAAPFYTINILFILLTRRDLAAVRKGNK